MKSALLTSFASEKVFRTSGQGKLTLFSFFAFLFNYHFHCFFVKWKRGCKLILNSSEATNSWAFYLNKLLSRTSQLRYNQQILSINFNQSIYIRSCYPDIRQETVICYLLDDIENAAIHLEEMRIISKSIEKKAVFSTEVDSVDKTHVHGIVSMILSYCFPREK